MLGPKLLPAPRGAEDVVVEEVEEEDGAEGEGIGLAAPLLA